MTQRNLASVAKAAFLLGLMSLGNFSACSPIDPDPPVDADGEPLDTPEAYDEWLNFVSVSPDSDEPLSTHPTLAIEFNAYLDTSSFLSFRALRLQSGDIYRGGDVQYRMSEKTLLFRPYQPLEPDLNYLLRWLADDVRSVTGAPLFPYALLPRFDTDADLPPSPPLARPEVGWADVDAIFSAHCNSCHADPDWQLPSLEHGDLIDKRSGQVDQWLVAPFFPERSYLMHKILPDYPRRRFTVQPPPWSDVPPLSEEDIATIEHWIAAGAPGSTVAE